MVSRSKLQRFAFSRSWFDIFFVIPDFKELVFQEFNSVQLYSATQDMYYVTLGYKTYDASIIYS